MTCLHPRVLITRSGEEAYEASCQECDRVFTVDWMELGGPCEETGWQWGELKGIDLCAYGEED